jgi:Protein of unknown function (DUF2946)
MRALRLRFLLFVLAMAVQALLPVASGVAAGGIARGGLSEICLKAVGDLDHEDGRSSPAHSHQRDCPLCQAFCDGVAPVGGSSAGPVVSPVQWSTLAWASLDSPAPAAASRFAHRARAPPAA